jgi:hypothetical protein
MARHRLDFGTVCAALAGAIACGLLTPLQAFPPAPGVVVHGTVRDASGWPVDELGATVVFRSGDRVLGRVSINSDLSFDENYRALLPVDMKTSSGPYKPGVVEPNLPFTVQVEVGGQAFLPIEAAFGIGAPAEPGSVIRMDLTLGTDSDGDGLPDEWEFWQLQGAGIIPGSPGYDLDQFSRDGDFDRDGLGDYDEYLAGTYAYLGSDHLQLHVVRREDDGWLELEFLAIIDKAYRFEASPDLESWAPVAAGLDGSRFDLRTAFRASNTRLVRVWVPPDATSGSRHYRAAVR